MSARAPAFLGLARRPIAFSALATLLVAILAPLLAAPLPSGAAPLLQQLPAGTIVIAQSAAPKDDSSFSFTDTIAAPNTFTLRDPGANTKIFTNLAVGSYTVTSTLPAGWALRGIACSDSNSTGSVSSRAASISLEAGETVTCTFTTSWSGLKVSNGTPVRYSEQAAPVVVAPTLAITFDAGDPIASARVEILRGYQQGADVLSIGTATATSGTVSSISWSWDAARGLLTLSGEASTATYQSVLRQITFRNSSDTPTSAQREVRISVGSGLQWTNGHFYEYVAGDLTWASARAAAATKRYFGLQGYLVTVTSAAETEFLINRLGGREAWIGATDSVTDGEWRWVSGPEGLEDGGRGRIFSSGPTAVSGQYANWNPGEPNSSGDVAYFIRQGCTFVGCIPGKWDDIPSTANAAGYVVEYGGMPGDAAVSLAGSALVDVIPVNDTPTNITLSATSIGENLPAGTLVGALGAADIDHTSGFTYALVAGAGDTDNAAFRIGGAQLKTARSLDFEAQSSYSVRIQVSDPAGGTFEQAFTVTVTDNPLAPTLTSGAPPATAVYGEPYQFTFQATGEPDPTFNVSAGALPPGLTLEPSGMLSGTLSAAGTYTFTIQAANGTTPVARQVTINVQKAPLTVRANDLTVTTGGAIAPSASFTGFRNGDDAGDLDAAVQFGALSSAAPGTFPIVPSGAADANYAITFANGTLTVDARPVPEVVWGEPVSIPYGTPLTASQYNVVFLNPNPPGQTLTGQVSYSPPLGTVLPAGAGQLLTAVFTPTGAFAPLTATRVITVTPAPLIVRAEDKTVFVGNALPALTAAYSGFVGGDGPDDLDRRPALSTAVNASQLGEFAIVVSGAADPNYTFSYERGALTVLAAKAAPQIVTRSLPGGVYGRPYSADVLAVGSPITMTYALTGALPAGLSFNAAQGQISGTPTETGTFGGLTLQAANGVAPAASRSFTLTIAPAPLTVTADPQTKQQGASNPALTLHYEGFVLGEDAGSSPGFTPPTATTVVTDGTPVGSYPIILSNGSSSRYTLTLLNSSLTVSAQLVPVVSWSNPAAITYGTALTATQLNASATCDGTGLVNGFNADYYYYPAPGTVLRAGAARALQVTVVPRIPTCTSVTRRVDLLVNPRPLTIIAPSPSIPAGSTLPALTPTFSGLRPGDSGAKLRTPAVVTTAADKNLAGSYAVLVSGAADPNYAPITYVNGTLTVTASSSTGGVPPSGAPGSIFPYTARGFTPGATVTLTVNGKVVGTATADAAGVVSAALTFDPQTPAGTYTVRASGAPNGAATEQPVAIGPNEPLRTDSQDLPPIAARPVAPGSIVPLVTGGFTPGEQIDVTVNAVRIGTLTAGPTGVVTTALDLVSSAPGTRTIAFTGRSSGGGSTAQVAVDPAGPLVIDPAAGLPGGKPILGVTPGGPGSYFAVTFGGFTPGQQVPLLVDGTQAGTAKAGSDGVIRTAVYLDPSMLPGQHTIQAGPGGPTAQVTVAQGAPGLPAPAGVPVVQGKVEEGAPGGYFPFEGSGFTPGEQVTIFRNDLPLGTVIADASGKVQLAVKFEPNMPVGTYQIGAAGATSGTQIRAMVKVAADGPQRHDPGNLPVLSATGKVYLPLIRRP